MLTIEPITGLSNAKLCSAARALFREYADFLRSETKAHGAFDFERFDEETQALPLPYTTAGGEVLLIFEGNEPVGCIAYRAVPTEEEGAFEIKRFFVRPACRGRGFGEQLVRSVLEHAKSRGFRVAYLDTEPRVMDAAHSLYLKLGFIEYERREQAGGYVALLSKVLS